MDSSRPRIIQKADATLNVELRYIHGQSEKMAKSLQERSVMSI
jgi:hypothetical protein